MSLAAVNRRRFEAKGAARQGDRAMRELRSRAGFTLTEALATVIIVGLVSAILASGIALASRQYTQSMVSSEAQMLYSSLQKILDTELRYTSAITESDDKSRVTGFESKHYKAREVAEGGGSSFVATENLCTILEGADGVTIQSPDQPGMLAMTSGFDSTTAVYSPLLGSGAYNYGLKASIPSIRYVGESGNNSDSGYFVVNLVVSRGDNPGTPIVDETFTVKAMNLYESKSSSGPSGNNTPGSGGSGPVDTDNLTPGDIQLGWRGPENSEEAKEVSSSTVIGISKQDKLSPGTIITFTLHEMETYPENLTIKLFLVSGKGGNGSLKGINVVEFNGRTATVVLPSNASNGSLRMNFVVNSTEIGASDITVTVTQPSTGG